MTAIENAMTGLPVCWEVEEHHGRQSELVER